MDIETTRQADPHPPVIEIPPMQLAVSGTYADGRLNIVQGRLDEDLTVQLPGGASQARLTTDGVVMVASDEVVMIAFGVRPEQGTTGSAESGVEGLDLISRTEDALRLASQAMRRVTSSHRP